MFSCTITKIKWVLVKYVKRENRIIEIDMSGLPKGIYLLKIKTQNQLYTKEIIVIWLGNSKSFNCIN